MKPEKAEHFPDNNLRSKTNTSFAILYKVN